MAWPGFLGSMGHTDSPVGGAGEHVRGCPMMNYGVGDVCFPWGAPWGNPWYTAVLFMGSSTDYLMACSMAGIRGLPHA